MMWCAVSEPKMQKLIEIALLIVRECAAVLKTSFSIERKRRVERRPAAGFEA